jgi:hypothetical protein
MGTSLETRGQRGSNLRTGVDMNEIVTKIMAATSNICTTDRTDEMEHDLNIDRAR